MSAYFLYHSIGTFPGKEAALAKLLGDFASDWAAPDDGQWAKALGLQAAFLGKWARIIGAPAANVAQAESVTGALYTILRGLPDKRLAGGKVLVAADCFPSLHLLLAETVRRLGAELVTVAPAPGEAWVGDEQMLAHWDGKVRLALLTWVTSTSSHKSNIRRLVGHGHRMGSLVGVDVTQGIGIRPYDVAEMGADFTVGSSLKWLCGVSGAGVIHATDALIAACEPEFRGWFSQANPFAWELDGFSFAPDARRFGNGTPNVLPAIGSIPGLDHAITRGVEALAADNAAKVARLYDWLRAAGLRLVSPLAPEARGGSLMVALPPQFPAAEVINGLREIGVHADARGQILRLSPGSATTDEGIDRLCDGLGARLGVKAVV